MTGRPTLFTPELADTICERLASGQSLRAVCRDESMPSEATVRRWALDDHQGFSAQYARAREIGAHAMADALLDIADDGSNDFRVDPEDGTSFVDHEHIQRSKLRVDARRWLLSKMLPKVYGDRLELDAVVKQSVVSDRPLTEEEWAAQYGRGDGGAAA